MTNATPPKLLPPVYFLVYLLVAMALHWAVPVVRLMRPPYTYGGVLLITVEVFVIGWAAYLFNREGTAIKPFETSSALVLNGPYRVSRNPMYLGLMLILIGAVEDQGNSARIGGSLDAIQVELRLRHRIHRGEKHGHVLRPAAGHDGVDRNLFHRR